VRIAGSLNARLRLIAFDYMMEPVRVLALKDIGPLPLPEGVVNVRRGDELDVPRWQALELESRGLVDVRDRGIKVDDVNMYHYREKRGQAANQLQGLPRNFYLEVRDLISRIDRVIRENPTTMLIRDREVVEKNLLELSEARLLKIVRLAISGGDEFKERMTPEETIIYDAMREIVEVMRSYVKGLVRGEAGG